MGKTVNTKRVLAIGTFDILHKGHFYYLEQSRRLGQELYVLISRDLVVKKVKGRLPLNNEKKRRESIREISFVKKAFLGSTKDMLSMVLKVKPDIISLGYDQKAFTKNLSNELKKRGINPLIRRIKPFFPDKFKSSLLRQKLDKADRKV